MRTLTVQLGDRSYPIHIGQHLLDQPELLTRYVDSRQVLIVTNETVAPLYLEKVKQAFADRQLATVILPDGESYKTVDSAMMVFDELLRLKFRRWVAVSLAISPASRQPAINAAFPSSRYPQHCSRRSTLP
jgi:3-dehydroquinate synthase